MKTIYTSLPIYDKLAKQCFERGRHAGHDTPVPIVCPRHRLPSFQWEDGTDGAASVTKVELMIETGVYHDITDHFTLPTWIPLEHDYFSYKGNTLLQLLDAGIYYLRITMNNGFVYYSEWFKVDCVYDYLVDDIDEGGNNYDLLTTSGATIITAVYSRWHLPSLDELDAMYDVLELSGVGGFSHADYWSSTEDTADNAWRIDFNSGASAAIDKDALCRVRACHSFTSATIYALRDVGPGGGLIFYKNGNDYMEAAAADTSASKTWSNVNTVAVTGTGTAVGTGQANTRAIIAQATHATSAAYICDQIDTAARYIYSSEFTVVKGETIRVTLSLTNTLQLPTISIWEFGGALISNTVTLVAGSNDIDLIITAASVTAVIKIANTGSANFSTGGIIVSKNYSEKYLILDFHNDCDIGDLLYHTGFTQTLWFESEPMETKFPQEEKGVENGEGRFIRTFARQVRQYLAKTNKMPDYMVDVFNRMKLHDSIEMTDLVGDTNTVYNLEVDHDWLYDDKYYAKIDLKFDYDESVVIAGCCNNLT